jgi:hydroxymethylpyrimidine/phosphomethylpyrimidine kinase
MTSTVPRQSALPEQPDPVDDSQADRPPCVLVFNASDPSGAGGLAADIGAIASVGAHALPIVTGAYTRDTAEIIDHHAFDDEAVREQARTVLEDIAAEVIKVGFVGSIENISAIAEIAADYADIPLIAYMPDLSWWSEVQIDLYLDAFRDLMLPQTTVLVGNHSTLCRWLLPDWKAAKSPGPRDVARAAHAFGVAYTLVTGMLQPDQFIANALATSHAVLVSDRFERFEEGALLVGRYGKGAVS